MFQKYVPDVITSYKRHIFFLEQIHIHMVFSRYKYGSDANKCGVRTFIFIKKSHCFESIFPKNQPKFDLFLNICLTSVFTKITFCWILQILIIFQYVRHIYFIYILSKKNFQYVHPKGTYRQKFLSHPKKCKIYEIFFLCRMCAHTLSQYTFMRGSNMRH